MTKINKLVLDGFKSFGKRTELVFSNGFNCVLGPNGSGKSNIIDAICFVLGRTSAKSLRAEKSSNLIYNGGKTKKPAKEAEVSIYFDNSDKTFPLPESEIKISRIVKQNGQSIYKINNKTTTRQGILDLLSIAKINPEGQNIILQGDIIRIIEMSSIERRMLIEEIAGINIYEDKKQKALNELSKVEEKLKEAGIILSEREQRLKELKKDRDDAIKYKEINEKINKNKASLLKIEIKKKEREKEECERKLNGKNERLSKIQNSISELKKEIEKRKEEIENINKEIEAKGEKEQLIVHKEVENIRVEIATTKNKLESYQSELEKIKERKGNLLKSAEEIESKIKILEKEKKETHTEISSLEKALKEINDKIEEFKKKNSMSDAAEIEKEIDNIDKISEEMQREIQLLRQEQQDLLRKKDRLEFQIASFDEKIEKALILEKEHKDQIELLKKKRNDLKKITLELNQRLTDDSSLASQIAEAKRKIEKASEELTKLETRNISVQESIAGDIAVKKILDSKIKGIYGLISDLGQTSSIYSLALEVAAGPRIKGIVVEDDKTAAECIDYLKKNKYGIATFLPLNKIKAKKIDDNLISLKDENGVHGFAIDLIKFDPKFKNVFSYVFGDTLVVDNIETARRIGVGKIKMVTIDGDLIELSGAMQGGYRLKKSLGLGFKEEEVIEGIKKNKELIESMSAVIKTLEKRKKECEESISKLREDKAILEGEIIKMEKALHMEGGDIDVNKKLKSEVLSQLKDIEKELSGIENKISNINSEFTKLKIKKQELREKVNMLRNPALVAELTAFEEKKNEISSKIIELNASIKNIDVQLNTILIPEKENTLKVVRQHNKEEEIFKEQIRETNENIKKLSNLLKEKEKYEQEFFVQFKELFARRTKIDEEIKKLESKISILIENEKEEALKLNSISMEHARISAEFDALIKEFEQYQGVEIFTNKSEDELKKEIKEAESFIAKMANSINMRALVIYETIEKEYNEFMDKKEKLRSEKEDILIMINEIETKKKELFLKTFETINDNFKRIFSALSPRGEAYLSLENKEDPFEGGVVFKVKITGNKFLDIRGLSGGEKTLTALALIFAIQEHEPAYFYVFDEVDAALDKRNSEKLATLIKKYAEKAQYIVISHNDAIISEASILYGISMADDGISKVASLKI